MKFKVWLIFPFCVFKHFISGKHPAFFCVQKAPCLFQRIFVNTDGFRGDIKGSQIVNVVCLIADMFNRGRWPTVVFIFLILTSGCGKEPCLKMCYASTAISLENEWFHGSSLDFAGTK